MKNLIATVAVAAVSAAMAEVKVSEIFSDNMVLQRGKPVPVWGMADPGEKVRVAFQGACVEGVAGADGRWEVRLPPQDVLKKGAELSVNDRTFRNVLVGDVWLCSGQSNMAYTMARGVNEGAADIFNPIIEEAKTNDLVRETWFRKVKRPLPQETPVNGPWNRCGGGSTAVGYLFAREIVARTGIPVGVLHNAWSGCAIEPYIPLEGFRSVPQLKQVADKLERDQAKLRTPDGMKAYRAHIDGILRWAKQVEEDRAAGIECDRIPEVFLPADTRNSVQYNAMVNPIVRFPIAGAIWYQGESNSPDLYRYKLHALVNGWREKWGYEFPFYIVQLAAYTAPTDDPAGGNGYARNREEQWIASKEIAKSGIATAIDIGMADNIHPYNKADIGTRLALWALRDVYGFSDIVVSGPQMTSAKAEGDRMRIRFDYVGSGLVAAEKPDPNRATRPVPCADGKLKGFAVAGADRKWFWADAAIDGDTVVVSSKNVPKPVAVRYAFRANPMGNANLYNREGLPALPFRSDCW